MVLIRVASKTPNPEGLPMMSVRQEIIPMNEFAQAMRQTSESFAKRVRGFEDVFGTVDPDTLAVIAQATYFCWFEVEYEQDYLDVCRAIGLGRPTSIYLCGQVSPCRWTEMNTYVVGVQRWLGVERPLFCELSSAKLKQIYEWLGDRIPAKESVADLFVANLATSLSALSFARLSRRRDPSEERYFDFTPWYSGSEGAAGSGESPAAVVAHLKRRIREDMNSAGEDTQELISGILAESQPACHHRFSRYQDIKITSIGALKWRGNLPPDVDVPKHEARDWFEKQADLGGWLTGKPPTTRLLTELYAALGTPTDRKKAIIRDFLYGPPEGGYDWLVDRATQDGTTVSAIFGQDMERLARGDADKTQR
jgi:hypothetical protein